MQDKDEKGRQADTCSEACVHPFYCTAFATTPQLPGRTVDGLFTYVTFEEWLKDNPQAVDELNADLASRLGAKLR